MKKHIVLIDYENVHAIDLKPLLNHDVLIKVFHGGKDKFTSDFTNMAIRFGKDKIELIQIVGEGKNALDFHIAYFIGKFANEIEDPAFHIISKDKGFKPLVDFLMKQEKKSCFLVSTISEISLLKSPITHVQKTALPKTIDDWYKIVLEKLSVSKVPKPKKKKTLRNQIISYCHKAITEDDANAILQNLANSKLIEFKNENVIYH